eukprot:scaffold20311_cov135-Isochrysis_galbana.AAC.2
MGVGGGCGVLSRVGPFASQLAFRPLCLSGHVGGSRKVAAGWGWASGGARASGGVRVRQPHRRPSSRHTKWSSMPALATNSNSYRGGYRLIRAAKGGAEVGGGGRPVRRLGDAR